MVCLRFKINFVDEYGFCGRENHPSKSDVGLIVKPLRMAVEVYNGEGDYLPNHDAGCIEALNNTAIDGVARVADKPVASVCWTCVTEDGRLLDLMDFEISVETTGDEK